MGFGTRLHARVLLPHNELPGLPSQRHRRIVHDAHWADGGKTSLDHPILLCPTRHRLVHEGGFDVQLLDDGIIRNLLGDRKTRRGTFSRYQ